MGMLMRKPPICCKDKMEMKGVIGTFEMYCCFQCNKCKNIIEIRYALLEEELK